MSNNCPICEKDDQIKKVSAIVQGGKSHSTGQMPVGYSYTDSDGHLRSGTKYENFSTTHISDQAKMLLPPPPPKAPQSTWEYRSYLMVLLIAPIMFFFVWAGTLVSYVSGALGKDILNLGSSSIDVLAFGFYWLISSVLCFLGTRKYRMYHQRTTEAYKVELPMWEKAMKRWESLYYCERDDSIHAPGENSSPVSEIMEYVGWRPYQQISFF